MVTKIINDLKQSRTKRYFLYLCVICGYTGMIFAYAHVKASAIEASIIAIPPMPAFTAQQLALDLSSRVKYLQMHVTGAAFTVYKVRPKDNLWKIASKKHYSVHSIIGCNPQLKTYDVSIGQELVLPSRGGVLHPVFPEDTWETVAKRYKVNPADIKKANQNTFRLEPGNMVFVPGGRPDMDLMNEDMKKKYELRALFVSPLGGRLSSTFGMRWHPVTGQRTLHAGIDIAVHDGTMVGAAAPGVVTVASDCAGHYGKAVFIEHQNGYQTEYGHLSKILVRVGQRVKEHQLIARSGSTGRVTGPHLHFTIRKNGTPLDPLKFLW